MTTTRLQYLLDRYYQQQATPAEEMELMDYVAQQPETASLDSLLQQHWESLSVSDVQYTAATGAPMLKAILGAPQRKAFRLAPVARWAAAATVAGIVAAGFWWHAARNTPPYVQQAAVIKPGSSRAVLTLGNGQTIALDSTGHQQIGASVSQQGGQLLYAGNAGTPQQNTLTTPRGGQFRVTLPDGTEAWLNANSSLTYPTAFSGNQRLVAVQGEVYFAVAKDAARPFQVRVNNGLAIDVLGTEFNVNAYTDEPSINTTLVQGKVNVHLGAASAVVLQPGQQARVADGHLDVLPGVDVEQITAWKNGVFNFEGVDVPGVMRQLSRWYDIEVVYAGAIPQRRFGGEVQRGLQLQQVLVVLEKVGINYKIEGRKLIVLPD
ncbi:iron dicitrate transport regulator FecR [Chitinophaga parva]|uniref:Iron dicitrate transport regulator FecR n=1 Tax=Chitinophaga parva TaxID=2169414 RepID=A0A2T7BMG5_9BACT|nr:FecR domain-containing protein [Chitinophaga parva]PUZ28862.1 iron dicitrate transport regulator FecR [Chitinophaga parva]